MTVPFPGHRFSGAGCFLPPHSPSLDFAAASYSPPPFFAAAALLRAFLIRRGAYAPPTLLAPKIPQSECVQFPHILARAARTPCERFSVWVVSLPSRTAQNAERCSVSCLCAVLSRLPERRTETESAGAREKENRRQSHGVDLRANPCVNRAYLVRNCPQPSEQSERSGTAEGKRKRKLRIMLGNFAFRTEISVCTEKQNRGPRRKTNRAKRWQSFRSHITYIISAQPQCGAASCCYILLICNTAAAARLE